MHLPYKKIQNGVEVEIGIDTIVAFKRSVGSAIQVYKGRVVGEMKGGRIKVGTSDGIKLCTKESLTKLTYAQASTRQPISI